MADRIIDDNILILTANALRAKGITGQIEYKDNGFTDAISSINYVKDYDWSFSSK